MTNDIFKQGTHGNCTISLGRFSYGFERISIRDFGDTAALTIGSFCSISSDVTIFLSGNHRMDWVSTFPFGAQFEDELQFGEVAGICSTNGDVTIGDDVWIGHGVTIMSGITIGSGAVLAANSHIIKDVLPYEIVGGNPAKLIRNRFPKEIVEKLMILKWWNLPVQDIRDIRKVLTSVPEIDVLDALIERYRPANE